MCLLNVRVGHEGPPFSLPSGVESEKMVSCSAYFTTRHGIKLALYVRTGRHVKSPKCPNSHADTYANTLTRSSVYQQYSLCQLQGWTFSFLYHRSRNSVARSPGLKTDSLALFNNAGGGEEF